ALSLGASGPLSSFELFTGKAGVFATLDHLAANWMLPIGALLVTLFVGWKLGKKVTMEELGLQSPTLLFKIWFWIIRVVAPAAVSSLLLKMILGHDFS
ncbi:MAG TPA: hypothetical protein VLJ10_04355, partial [Candidatus Bathyarchaeia archaeon]|nr:hypothetical protein [Candidatus Bathyarchaeia archaeon]